MRLEFEPNSSTAATFVEKEVVAQDVSSERERMFREGVRAAQEGNRVEARNLLLRVTESNADNENAWLWLASISEYPEELLVFLNHVLRINPHNERALEWNAATKSLLAKTLVQNALAAAFDGAHDEAREMLAEVLERDAEMEDAWVLRSHLADSFEERAESLLKVRVLNPENEMAKAVLASWRNLSEKLSPVVAEPAEETSFAPLNEFAPGNGAEDFSERGEFSAENDAGNQFSDESEPATAAEFNAPESVVAEDTESFDAPTQELRFEPHYQQPEAPDCEASATAGTAQTENSFEDSQTDEVHFETVENEKAEPADFEETEEKLKAELKAEEAEMNWAFSNSPRNLDVEDYFRSDDDDDDIHKTQQANYEPADFAPGFGGGTENAEAVAELTEEASNQAASDWRDASPTVFVDYSSAMPESAFESETVHFSDADKQEEGEETAEAVEPMMAEERFETPQMSFEDSLQMNFEESPLPRFESDSAAPPVEEAAAETVSMQATQEPSEEMVEDTSAAASRAETVLCPFCDAENEKQAFLCSSCQTVLTLSDLEMLISQQSADQDKLRPSVESLERENESYGLNVEQMMSLGIGHVNLKNYRQGFFYLQEAVRMNPSNVLFDAQVNALAIRLAEMEEQQSAHDLMSKNRKILVVDDSPTVRKLISGKLEKCGHEVVCAIDGVDALEKIKELKPDLVLLDITMPRLDGYQVCKMIRSNDSTKDVPVVMISGKDGFFDKVRGRMAGTSGYITKPFGPETLMKTVETYLN